MSRLFVSTRKGLFCFESNRDGDWRLRNHQFLGDRVSLTMIDPRDGAVYAALDHGHFGIKLHRSDDGGSGFTQIATPAFPKKPDGLKDVNAQGKEVPWAVQLIWALAAGGDDEPGALWCGTIPGGLFRSADRGASWQLVESLWQRPERAQWFGGGYDYPGIHSICVDPRDSRRVVVGVSCGGVWQTRDRGDTWSMCARGMRAAYMPPERSDDEAIQDPHLVVQCRAQPDYFWSQHHNGIFYSRNDCESWQEIVDGAPATFGFAVAVHPGHGDTAWFVPAVGDQQRVPVDGKLAVTRTRDGGQTFEVLRNGLPSEHAYDLIFRHALAIDPTGSILALGSTTGNLWISDDQGEHFRALSHHLPPIAAVALVD